MFSGLCLCVLKICGQTVDGALVGAFRSRLNGIDGFAKGGCPGIKTGEAALKCAAESGHCGIQPGHAVGEGRAGGTGPQKQLRCAQRHLGARRRFFALLRRLRSFFVHISIV